MGIVIRQYEEKDVPAMVGIWNRIVDDGEAFVQEEGLTDEEGLKFFADQTYSAVAEDEDTGEVVGLYILHPNNIGRCGHIGNASYGVLFERRGQHIGEMLVSDSLKQAAVHGFGLIQFNAVVENNIHARHLYSRLGFVEVGMIPRGFRMKDGHYENIYVYYHVV